MNRAKSLAGFNRCVKRHQREERDNRQVVWSIVLTSAALVAFNPFAQVRSGIGYLIASDAFDFPQCLESRLSQVGSCVALKSFENRRCFRRGRSHVAKTFDGEASAI